MHPAVMETTLHIYCLTSIEVHIYTLKPGAPQPRLRIEPYADKITLTATECRELAAIARQHHIR